MSSPLPAEGGTAEPDADLVTEEATPRRSFRTNSAARFLSDTYLLFTSLVAAAITARLLGPSGKGFYSTLMLLAVLASYVFNLGLGEAAVVLVGKGRAAIATAVPVTMLALIPLALVGAGCFLAVAWAILHPAVGNESAAVVVGSILVLFNVASTSVIWFLVLQERIVLVAVLLAVSSTITTASIWYLVAYAGQGAAGAVAASLLGCLVVLAAALHALRRAGVPLRPAWRPGYLPAAARFGGAVQMSNLLVQMTGRLDLVLVYGLASPAAAGTYSVALAVGALVGGVPMALAFASFPRLAQLDDGEARAFTLQVFRMGLAAALASAGLLGLLTPLVVPLVFGHQYLDSVGPTLPLLAGGVCWSAQWILTRAAAARGQPRALLVSFALSFFVMVALDLVLIGPLGDMGAAIASSVGSVVGFAAAASFYRGWEWRQFLPGREDCRHVVAFARDLVASVLKRRRAGALGG